MSELAKLRDSRLKSKTSPPNIPFDEAAHQARKAGSSKYTVEQCPASSETGDGKGEEDREISDSRKTDTPRKAPASHQKKPRTKILTAVEFGKRIAESKIGICGEKAVKNWFHRNGALDAASLTYLIEIIRELQEEGYK